MIKYIVVLLFSVGLSAQGSLVFDTPFETSVDIDGTIDAWQSISTNDATITIDGTSRVGTGYLKLTSAGGALRSELTRQYTGVANTYFIDWNTEYWVGYPIRINTAVQGYGILTQFRPYGDNGSNAYTLQNNTGNKLSFLLATNDAIVNDTPDTAATWGAERYDADYVIGQWHDIVMHFNLSTTTSGYWEVWVDGIKVVDEHNTVSTYAKHINGIDKDPRNYMKIGAYYGSGTGADIDFDSFKIWEGAGGSYEDVSPLGLSPSGTPVPNNGKGHAKRKLIIMN